MSDRDYGSLIKKMREERGISAEGLANILLIPEEKLLEIENGSARLSETELRLCANIFNVSEAELNSGKVKTRITADELSAEIQKFAQLYIKALESQSYILKIIQEFSPPVRYSAGTYCAENELTMYGYAVYDSWTGKVLCDESGKIKEYETAKEALEAAQKLDNEFKMLAEAAAARKETVETKTAETKTAETVINETYQDNVIMNQIGIKM